MRPMDVTRWCPDELTLGEGPRWVDGRLVLVDIVRGLLLEAPDEPGPLRVVASVGDLPLSAVAPVAGDPDRWIVAVGRGIAFLEPHGGLHWVERPEPAGNRMNDGCCDPTGRFWAGSMGWEQQPGAGSLYRVDHDGSVRRVLDGITIANGPAFSPDGATLYLADSGRHRLDAYPVDLATGDLGAPRELLVTDHGVPDGLTVDADGFVWAALNGAGRAVCLDPSDASVRHSVDVPVEQVSAPCLGGPDGRRLYLTTAWESGDEQDRPPGAGAVYAVDVAVPGPPAQAFGPLPTR